MKRRALVAAIRNHKGMGGAIYLTMLNNSGDELHVRTSKTVLIETLTAKYDLNQETGFQLMVIDGHAYLDTETSNGLRTD